MADQLQHGAEIALDLRVNDRRREIWCGIYMGRTGDGISIRPWGHHDTRLFRSAEIERIASLRGIDDDTRTRYTRRQRGGEPAKTYEV